MEKLVGTAQSVWVGHSCPTSSAHPQGRTAGKGTASAEPLEGKDGRFRRLREMDYLDSEGQCHANRGL
jgi:hypothetical protein